MLTYTIAYYIPLTFDVDAKLFDRFIERCRQEDVTQHAKITQLLRDWVGEPELPDLKGGRR